MTIGWCIATEVANILQNPAGESERKPAIVARLQERNFPFIINTVLPYAAIKKLIQDWKLECTMVTEHGCVIQSSTNHKIIRLMPELSRQYIQNALIQIKADSGFQYSLLHEWDLRQISGCYHCSTARAEQLNTRSGSEVLFWEDQPEKLADMPKKLEKFGLKMVEESQGWCVVPLAIQRSTAMDLICGPLDARKINILALGSGERDRHFLEAMDIPVSIPDSTDQAIHLGHSNQIEAPVSGVTGWAAVVERWFDLVLNKKQS